MEAREIWDLSWRIINFGILVALVVKFLGRPTRDFLDNRQGEIRTTIDEIRNDREKVVAKAEEFREKLMGLDREIKEMTHRINSEAQRERIETVEVAKETFREIIESARRKAALEAEKAKLVLRKEVADMVVKLAQENIKKSITPDHHRVLIDQYLFEILKISDKGRVIKGIKRHLRF